MLFQRPLQPPLSAETSSTCAAGTLLVARLSARHGSCGHTHARRAIFAGLVVATLIASASGGACVADYGPGNCNEHFMNTYYTSPARCDFCAQFTPSGSNTCNNGGASTPGNGVGMWTSTKGSTPALCCKWGETSCAAGKYGAGACCLDCPAGMYQNSAGKSTCLSCPAGRSQAAGGQTSCAECAMGSYSYGAPCADHADGGCPTHYANGGCANNNPQYMAFRSRCPVSCGVCTHSSHFNPPNQNCKECSPGYYQHQVGKTHCKFCVAGQFQNQTGRSKCKNCAAGRYQNQNNQGSCKTCPTGHYQHQNGINSCQYCPAGWYQNLDSQSKCKTCASGQYQNQIMQGSCKTCPTGHYQNQNTQGSCKGCGAGNYQNQNVQSGCKTCPTGHYQNQNIQGSCKGCGAGNYQNQNVQSGCKTCPNGHYQDQAEKNACIACGKGTYRSDEGQAGCNWCGQGTFQDQTTQTKCKNCAAGTYQAGTKKSACIDCAAGQYQDQAAQTSCVAANFAFPEDDATQTFFDATFSTSAYHGFNCGGTTPTTTYATKSSGTCESNGMQTMMSEAACLVAGRAYSGNANLAFTADMPAGGYTGVTAGRPRGCAYTGTSLQFFPAATNNNNCGVNGHHCLCRSSGTSPGETQENACRAGQSCGGFCCSYSGFYCCQPSYGTPCAAGSATGYRVREDCVSANELPPTPATSPASTLCGGYAIKGAGTDITKTFTGLDATYLYGIKLDLWALDSFDANEKVYMSVDGGATTCFTGAHHGSSGNLGGNICGGSGQDSRFAASCPIPSSTSSFQLKVWSNINSAATDESFGIANVKVLRGPLAPSKAPTASPVSASPTASPSPAPTASPTSGAPTSSPTWTCVPHGEAKWANDAAPMLPRKQECLAAAVAQFGAQVTATRSSLVDTSMSYAPPGCHVASGADWAAHFNPNPLGINNGVFTVVGVGARWLNQTECQAQPGFLQTITSAGDKTYWGPGCTNGGGPPDGTRGTWVTHADKNCMPLSEDNTIAGAGATRWPGCCNRNDWVPRPSVAECQKTCNEQAVDGCNCVVFTRAPYVLLRAGAGQDCADTGDVQITTSSECQAAATSLSLTVGTMTGWSQTNMPGGCLLEIDDNDVDFNSNLASWTANSDRHLICKSGADASLGMGRCYLRHDCVAASCEIKSGWDTYERQFGSVIYNPNLASTSTRGFPVHRVEGMLTEAECDALAGSHKLGESSVHQTYWRSACSRKDDGQLLSNPYRASTSLRGTSETSSQPGDERECCAGTSPCMENRVHYCNGYSVGRYTVANNGTFCAGGTAITNVVECWKAYKTLAASRGFKSQQSQANLGPTANSYGFRDMGTIQTHFQYGCSIWKDNVLFNANGGGFACNPSGWPSCAASHSGVAKCTCANAANDGYEYVYNTHRGTANELCSNCWCCRRLRGPANNGHAPLCMADDTTAQATSWDNDLDGAYRLKEWPQSVACSEHALANYPLITVCRTSGTCATTSPTSVPTQYPTSVPTRSDVFVGCFMRPSIEATDFVMDGASKAVKTWTECMTAAVGLGRVNFGLENPGVTATADSGWCLTLAGVPSWTQVNRSHCEAETRANGDPLGGSGSAVVLSEDECMGVSGLSTTHPVFDTDYWIKGCFRNPGTQLVHFNKHTTGYSGPMPQPTTRIGEEITGTYVAVYGPETQSPTSAPSEAPSVAPSSAAPTSAPASASPTASPTPKPTTAPTSAPQSSAPTASPLSAAPTASPTAAPTQRTLVFGFSTADPPLDTSGGLLRIHAQALQHMNDTAANALLPAVHANGLLVSLGGLLCADARWIDSNEIECMAPPAVSSLLIRLFVSGQEVPILARAGYTMQVPVRRAAIASAGPSIACANMSGGSHAVSVPITTEGGSMPSYVRALQGRALAFPGHSLEEHSIDCDNRSSFIERTAARGKVCMDLELSLLSTREITGNGSVTCDDLSSGATTCSPVITRAECMVAAHALQWGGGLTAFGTDGSVRSCPAQAGSGAPFRVNVGANGNDKCGGGHNETGALAYGCAQAGANGQPYVDVTAGSESAAKCPVGTRCACRCRTVRHVPGKVAQSTAWIHKVLPSRAVTMNPGQVWQNAAGACRKVLAPTPCVGNSETCWGTLASDVSRSIGVACLGEVQRVEPSRNVGMYVGEVWQSDDGFSSVCKKITTNYSASQRVVLGPSADCFAIITQPPIKAEVVPCPKLSFSAAVLSNDWSAAQHDGAVADGGAAACVGCGTVVRLRSVYVAENNTNATIAAAPVDAVPQHVVQVQHSVHKSVCFAPPEVINVTRLEAVPTDPGTCNSTAKIFYRVRIAGRNFGTAPSPGMAVSMGVSDTKWDECAEKQGLCVRNATWVSPTLIEAFIDGNRGGYARVTVAGQHSAHDTNSRLRCCDAALDAASVGFQTPTSAACTCRAPLESLLLVPMGISGQGSVTSVAVVSDSGGSSKSVQGGSRTAWEMGDTKPPSAARLIVTGTGFEWINDGEQRKATVELDGDSLQGCTVAATSIECPVPEGVGPNKVLTVRTFGGINALKLDPRDPTAFPAMISMLSYPPPRVATITGCPIGGCPREGNVVVTVTGHNFGPTAGADVIVFVGSSMCPLLELGGAGGKVAHHQQFKCTLPPGIGRQQMIVLIDGQSSLVTGNSTTAANGNTGTVTYLGCDLGNVVNTQQRRCEPCPKGRYSPGTLATECAACIAGRFDDVGTRSVCKNCEPGRYQPSEASVVGCKLCPSGRYQPSIAMSECEGCAAGMFRTVQTTVPTPSPSEAPTRSPTTSSTTTIASTYSPSSAPSAAPTTSPSDMAPVLLGRACDACPSGWRSESVGGFSCDPCYYGAYQFVAGSTVCKWCATGTFQDNLAQTQCEACPAGFVMPRVSAHGVETRSCDACTTGTFQTFASMSACKACDVGTFQKFAAQKECKSCAAGTAQGSTAATACVACGVGRHQYQVGQAQCKGCEAGRFQMEEGKTDCTDCPAGHSQASTEQSKCMVCSAGTSQVATSATQCKSCEAGTFQHEEARSVCADCPPGYFANEGGAMILCKACVIGMFQVARASTACVACAAGKFVNATAKSECKDCPAGHLQEIPEQFVCKVCSAGTYKLFTGMTACNACVEGTYQDATGKDKCKICPVEYWSPDRIRLVGPMSLRLVNVPSNVTSGETLPASHRPFVHATHRYAHNESAACTQHTENVCASSYGCSWRGDTCRVVADQASIVCEAKDSMIFTGGIAVIRPGAFNASVSELMVRGKPGSNVTVRYACRREVGGTPEDFNDEIRAEITLRECSPGEIYLGDDQPLCVQCTDRTFSKSPGEAVKQCHSCDEEAPGAICDHVLGTSIKRMRADKSYWIANRSSSKFYRCPVAGSCIGGIHYENGTTIRSRCHYGHTGVLCSQCEHGFSPGSGGACKRCDIARRPSEKGWIVWFVSTGVLVLVILVYLFCVARIEVSNLTTNLSAKAKTESKMDRALVTVQDQLRALVSFAQIFASFGLSFSSKTDYSGDGQRMVLPTEVLQICRFLDVFSFNFADVVAQLAPCDTSLSFSAKFALWMAALPTLLGVILIAHRIVLRCFPKAIAASLTDTAVVTANTCVFLLWPTVGRTLFQVFTFTTIEGEIFMLFDMSIRQSSSWWTVLASLAVAGVVVFVLGLPAFYFAMLYRQRRILVLRHEDRDSHWVHRRFSSLFEQYEPGYWYWEFCEMLRKLLLIGGVLVLQFNPAVQALFGLTVSIFYVVVLGNAQPYRDDSVDAVAQIGDVTMVLVLLLGSALSWWSGLQKPGPTMLPVDANRRQAAIDFFSGLSTALLLACLVASFLIIAVTLWNGQEDDASCLKGKAPTSKVHPVKESSVVEEMASATQGPKQRWGRFDPKTCTDVEKWRAEYGKLKDRNKTLRRRLVLGETSSNDAATEEKDTVSRLDEAPTRRTTRSMTMQSSNAHRQLKHNEAETRHLLDLLHVDRETMSSRERARSEAALLEAVKGWSHAELSGLHEAKRITDAAFVELLHLEHRNEHEQHAVAQANDQRAAATAGRQRLVRKSVKHKFKSEMSQNRLSVTLRTIDMDNSGTLDASEVVALYKHELGEEISLEHAEEIISAHDQDGDGILSIDELRTRVLRRGSTTG